jgi:hypothetical protein
MRKHCIIISTKRNLRNLRTGSRSRIEAELKTMPAEGGGGSNITQTSRIVGGTGAPQGKYPYFVQWACGCGASLIHSDILTDCGPRVTVRTSLLLSLAVGAYQNGQATFGAEVRQVVERSRHPKSSSSTDVND